MPGSPHQALGVMPLALQAQPLKPLTGRFFSQRHATQCAQSSLMTQVLSRALQATTQGPQDPRVRMLWAAGVESGTKTGCGD